MAAAGSKWEKNIDRAVSEMESGSARGQGAGLQLPNWLPYLMCILCGVLIANALISGGNVHAESTANRDYATGGKVALLMVAEDIQSYLDSKGRLPEASPSALTRVFDIRYERVADRHFRLSMNLDGDDIVFDAQEGRLTLE